MKLLNKRGLSLIPAIAITASLAFVGTAFVQNARTGLGVAKRQATSVVSGLQEDRLSQYIGSKERCMSIFSSGPSSPGDRLMLNPDDTIQFSSDQAMVDMGVEASKKIGVAGTINYEFEEFIKFSSGTGILDSHKVLISDLHYTWSDQNGNSDQGAVRLLTEFTNNRLSHCYALSRVASESMDSCALFNGGFTSTGEVVNQNCVLKEVGIIPGASSGLGEEEGDPEDAVMGVGLASDFASTLCQMELELKKELNMDTTTTFCKSPAYTGCTVNNPKDGSVASLLINGTTDNQVAMGVFGESSFENGVARIIQASGNGAIKRVSKSFIYDLARESFPDFSEGVNTDFGKEGMLTPDFYALGLGATGLIAASGIATGGAALTIVVGVAIGDLLGIDRRISTALSGAGSVAFIVHSIMTSGAFTFAGPIGIAAVVILAILMAFLSCGKSRKMFPIYECDKGEAYVLKINTQKKKFKLSWKPKCKWRRGDTIQTPQRDDFALILLEDAEATARPYQAEVEPENNDESAQDQLNTYVEEQKAIWVTNPAVDSEIKRDANPTNTEDPDDETAVYNLLEPESYYAGLAWSRIEDAEIPESMEGDEVSGENCEPGNNQGDTYGRCDWDTVRPGDLQTRMRTEVFQPGEQKLWDTSFINQINAVPAGAPSALTPSGDDIVENVTEALASATTLKKYMDQYDTQKDKIKYNVPSVTLAQQSFDAINARKSAVGDAVANGIEYMETGCTAGDKTLVDLEAAYGSHADLSSEEKLGAVVYADAGIAAKFDAAVLTCTPPASDDGSDDGGGT